MSAWKYAFSFPGSGAALDSAGFFVSSSASITWGNRIVPLVQGPDAQWLPGNAVENIDLDRVRSRLARGESLSVGFGGHGIFGQCSFVQAPSNPYIAVAWPVRSYLGLDAAARGRLEETLLVAMKMGQAAYGLFVLEPGDRFADRFLEVGGVRVIDQGSPGSTPCTVDKIWVDPGRGGSVPVGIALMDGELLRDGVVEYIRAETADDE